MVFVLGLLASIGSAEVQATQSTPTPTHSRSAYEIFPTGLVCDDAPVGPGPSWRNIITVGETTIAEIEATLEEGSFFEINELEGMLQFRLRDTTGFQQPYTIRVCEVDGIVTVVDIYMNEVEQTFYLPDIVYAHGIPDTVTYSTRPSTRILFWFELGMAAEIYIGSGASYYSKVVRLTLFPFQRAEYFSTRWPYNVTIDPEIGQYAAELSNAPYSEQNPFDFEVILATITAEPSRTPTPTFAPRVTQTPSTTPTVTRTPTPSP